MSEWSVGSQARVSHSRNTRSDEQFQAAIELLHLPQHFSHTAATARRRRTSHARVSPRSLPILCELLWCDSLRRTVTIIGSPGLPLPFAPHLSAITLPTRRPRPRRRSRTHHAPPPPRSAHRPTDTAQYRGGFSGRGGRHPRRWTGSGSQQPSKGPWTTASTPPGRRPPRGARGAWAAVAMAMSLPPPEAAPPSPPPGRPRREAQRRPLRARSCVT